MNFRMSDPPWQYHNCISTVASPCQLFIQLTRAIDVPCRGDFFFYRVNLSRFRLHVDVILSRFHFER